MLENDVKKAILDYLQYKGALVLRINSGARTVEDKQGERRHFKFVQWGCLGRDLSSAGVSDILALWRGTWLAIECKTPKRKKQVSSAQESFLNEISLHGGISIVATSVSDVEAVLENNEVNW